MATLEFVVTKKGGKHRAYDLAALKEELAAVDKTITIDTSPESLAQMFGEHTLERVFVKEPFLGADHDAVEAELTKPDKEMPTGFRREGNRAIAVLVQQVVTGWTFSDEQNSYGVPHDEAGYNSLPYNVRDVVGAAVYDACYGVTEDPDFFEWLKKQSGKLSKGSSTSPKGRRRKTADTSEPSPAEQKSS